MRAKRKTLAKNMKRLVSLVVVVVMILSTISLPAIAGGETRAKAGNYYKDTWLLRDCTAPNQEPPYTPERDALKLPQTEVRCTIYPGLKEVRTNAGRVHNEFWRYFKVRYYIDREWGSLIIERDNEWDELDDIAKELLPSKVQPYDQLVITLVPYNYE